MFLTYSAKLQDKRVDHKLETMGYSLADCEVFYSPIRGYLIYLGGLLLVIAPFCWPFYTVIADYYIRFLLYFTLVYLVLAYLNNSYALTEKQLIVINPNFPFRKVVVYDLASIQKVRIDHSKLRFILWVLLILGCNYVEIYTTNQVQRFYSIFLEVDAYDENITEKTMSSFSNALHKRAVKVDMNI